MAAYLSKQGLGQQVECWNEPPNYRMKLKGGLFPAERPRFSAASDAHIKIGGFQ